MQRINSGEFSGGAGGRGGRGGGRGGRGGGAGQWLDAGKAYRSTEPGETGGIQPVRIDTVTGAATIYAAWPERLPVKHLRC